MTDNALVLERADGEDLEYVETLLGRVGLPAEDVRDGSGRFYVATVGGDRVGTAGLEVYGDVALARSVAIEPKRRDRGYGTALYAALEARARALGVAELYLLTTTARAFFERQGFAAVDREAVPAPIRSTTEFRDRCPATAACMRRPIDPNA